MSGEPLQGFPLVILLFRSLPRYNTSGIRAPQLNPHKKGALLPSRGTVRLFAAMYLKKPLRGISKVWRFSPASCQKAFRFSKTPCKAPLKPRYNTPGSEAESSTSGPNGPAGTQKTTPSVKLSLEQKHFPYPLGFRWNKRYAVNWRQSSRLKKCLPARR